MLAAFMTGYMGKTAAPPKDLVGPARWGMPGGVPHGGITRHKTPGLVLSKERASKGDIYSSQELDPGLGDAGRLDEQGNIIPKKDPFFVSGSPGVYKGSDFQTGDVTRHLDIGSVDKDDPLYNVVDPSSNKLTTSNLDSWSTGGNITPTPPTPPTDNKFWDWKNPVLRGGAVGFASGAGISVILDWLRDKPASVRRMALMAVLGGAGGALYQALEGYQGIKSIATQGADATRNKIEELKEKYFPSQESGDGSDTQSD